MSMAQYLRYRRELFSPIHPVRPTIITMVGGPGSGKSSARKECIQSLKYTESDFVVIDPDEILTSMFNNNYNCYSDDEKVLDVITMNNLNFTHALKNGYNIVFDGTGRNIDFTETNVIGRAKRIGYRTVVCISMLDAHTALARVNQRGLATDRNVDSDFVKSTYDQLSVNIPKYLDIPKETVDILQVYDNTTDMVLV